MKKSKIKAKSTTLSEAHIYFPKELMDRIKEEAAKENRSLAAQIRHIMQMRYTEAL